MKSYIFSLALLAVSNVCVAMEKPNLENIKILMPTADVIRKMLEEFKLREPDVVTPLEALSREKSPYNQAYPLEIAYHG